MAEFGRLPKKGQITLDTANCLKNGKVAGDALQRAMAVFPKRVYLE